MRIVPFVAPGLSHRSYLLGDAGEAAILDPRRDIGEYIRHAYDAELRITSVLETHRNEDLVSGSLELARRTGASIGRSAYDEFPYAYGEPLHDGDEIQVGSMRLTVIHTPGHTPGHLSYLLRDPQGAPVVLFCGDALFAGAVGRTDLLGAGRTQEMTHRLFRTLREKILSLGDGMILCPAHGSGSVCGAGIADRPWTTIGIERAWNPSLQYSEAGPFVAAHASRHERPPYFDRMERWNQAGAPRGGPSYVPPVSAEEVQARASELQIVDVRSTLAFATAHVPRSLSIWEEGLSSYAGWFLDLDAPILLIGTPAAAQEASLRLFRLGADRVIGYLADGMRGWNRSGGISQSVETVPAAQFARQRLREAQILDVRTDREVERRALPSALHIPLTQLERRMDQVPRQVEIAVFCGTGLRSMIAASLLLRSGRQGVRVVLGGEEGWESSV